MKQLHHPSALDMFDKIIDASKGKQFFMFLDYDDTLSPIVDDPDRAFMCDSVFPYCYSDRQMQRQELYYVGSHGMDIKGPTTTSKYNKVSELDVVHDSKAEPILCQPASDFLPLIDEVYQQLVEKTKSTPGALVENNKLCLSVHFRCVDEKVQTISYEIIHVLQFRHSFKWSELARQVKSVLKEYPKLRLTQGRKVLEIRPTIKWDKGKALEFLLESLEQKEMLRNELELMNKSLEESEAQLQSRTVESNELVSQIALLKKEEERSLDKLNRMKNLKYEKELAGRVLQPELEALRTQYNDLKSYLLGDEAEKENFYEAFSNNLKLGLDEDSQNKTKLAELLRIRDANKVLNEMTESKIEAQNITGNTLINAYYKFGELKSALKFKNKLLEAGLKHDPFTYEALIHGFYKTNELERANELMINMVDAGFTPSYCTFSWIGDGYNKKDNMDAVLALPDDQDVLDLMRIVQKNRVVGATGLNERSTRCHSVLTVHVRGRELVSNSIVKVTESVCGGVPMICRPFFGDQGVAGRLIEDVWEIGVVMEGKVFTKNGLLKSWNLILVQEEGKKIRDNALKVKQTVQDATRPEGQAARDLKTLIEIISTTS
ncbi:putative trehalose-phosphate phosphatase H [Glycine max]|nr:putative trehalose-phosphate phosphatase H [Glycine max]